MSGPRDDPAVPCAEPGCGAAAAFRLYDPGDERWSPVCERHALAVHPSLELGALLESGYLKPVELGPPEGPPGEPRTARGEAFREAVEELLGWSTEGRDGA